MYTNRRLAIIVMVAFLLVALDVTLGHVPHVVASTPCDEVNGGPSDGPSEPLISGMVTDTVGAAPIQGATISLYRCSGTTAVYVTSDTTDSNGNYDFTGLTPQRWYFVQAVMTGPLSGKTPSGGTQNPTNLIGLGPSATNVDFAFQ